MARFLPPSNLVSAPPLEFDENDFGYIRGAPSASSDEQLTSSRAIRLPSFPVENSHTHNHTLLRSSSVITNRKVSSSRNPSLPFSPPGKLGVMAKVMRKSRANTTSNLPTPALNFGEPDPLEMIRDQATEEILFDCSNQITTAIRSKVNQILAQMDSRASLRTITGFERAFRDHLVAHLIPNSSTKRRQVQSIFKYLFDITLELGSSPLPRFFDLQMDEEHLFEDLSEEWCDTAKMAWSQNCWVDIMHVTGRALRMNLSSQETGVMKKMLSKLGTFIRHRSFRGKERLEQIIFDALEYFETHSIDPCNLFIGTSPAPQLEKKLVPLRTSKLSSSLKNDVAVSGQACGFLAFLGQEKEEQPIQQTNSFIVSSSHEMNLSRYLSRWGAMDSHPDRIIAEIKQLKRMNSNTVDQLRGEIVAVRVESIPMEIRSWYKVKEDIYPFIIGRIAGGGKSPTVVQVYLDSFESYKAEIPIEHVFCLDSWHTHFGSLFREPLAPFYPRCIDFIEKEVSAFIQKHGVTLGDPESFPDMQLPQIEKVFAELQIMEILRDDPYQISDFMASFLPQLTNELVEWAKGVADGFLAPKLEESLIEVTKFVVSIKELIMNEICHHVVIKTQEFNTLRRRVSALLKGERKAEICGWWLTFIEKKVDRYLQKCGYSPDAMAYDYMRDPPRDLAKVKENHNIIQNQFKSDNMLLDPFVEKITNEVYKKLDVLIGELEFMSSLRWKELPLKWGMIENEIECMEEDLRYLKKVRDMDEEIKKKRREGSVQGKHSEMTNVVPVAGLIMARFHILETEAHTALEIWDKKKAISLPKINLEGISKHPQDSLHQHFGLDATRQRDFFKLTDSTTTSKLTDSDMELIDNPESVARARDIFFRYQTSLESMLPLTPPASPELFFQDSGLDELSDLISPSGSGSSLTLTPRGSTGNSSPRNSSPRSPTLPPANPVPVPKQDRKEKIEGEGKLKKHGKKHGKKERKEKGRKRGTKLLQDSPSLTP